MQLKILLERSISSNRILDNYNSTRGPLAALNPQLMEATERLIREDLIGAIQDRAPVTEIQNKINTINGNLDQAEVLLQQ